jgi:hypothetical protein
MGKSIIREGVHAAIKAMPSNDENRGLSFRGLRKGRGNAKENIAKQKKVYINNEEGRALL